MHPAEGQPRTSEGGVPEQPRARQPTALVPGHPSPWPASLLSEGTGPRRVRCGCCEGCYWGGAGKGAGSPPLGLYRELGWLGRGVISRLVSRVFIVFPVLVPCV